MRGRIVGVQVDGRIEQGQRLAFGRFVAAGVIQRTPAQVGVKGRHVAGATRSGALILRCPRRNHFRGQRRGHGIRDFALHGEYVVDAPLENLRPCAETGAAINQVGGHAHVIARPAHAAIQQEGHAKLRRDLHRTYVAVAEFA